MSRNKQGLTGRQSRFLNTLALGRGTTEQVERQLGMARHTLRRWMDEPKFVIAWRQTNELLRLRHGADAAINGPGEDGAGDVAEAATEPQPASPAAPPVDVVAPEPRRARTAPAEARPPLSDRDRIRARHGEEAARAFDELLRRHRPSPDDAPAEHSPPPGGPPH